MTEGSDDMETVAELYHRIQANEEYYEAVQPTIRVYATKIKYFGSGYEHRTYTGTLAKVTETAGIGSSEPAFHIGIDEVDPPETRSARRYEIQADGHGAAMIGCSNSGRDGEVVRGIEVNPDD